MSVAPCGRRRSSCGSLCLRTSKVFMDGAVEDKTPFFGVVLLSHPPRGCAVGQLCHRSGPSSGLTCGQLWG
eukprot:3238346-Amphidinium_carterae.1